MALACPPGVAMSTDSLNVVVSGNNRDKFTAPLPTRRRTSAQVPRPRGPGGPVIRAAARKLMPDRPRVVRMPSDWWEGPSVAALPLGVGRQAGKNARRFTRETFTRWGLQSLVD